MSRLLLCVACWFWLSRVGDCSMFVGVGCWLLFDARCSLFVACCLLRVVVCCVLLCLGALIVVVG